MISSVVKVSTVRKLLRRSENTVYKLRGEGCIGPDCVISRPKLIVICLSEFEYPLWSAFVNQDDILYILAVSLHHLQCICVVLLQHGAVDLVGLKPNT